MCLYLRMRVLSEETDLNVAHEPPRRATHRKHCIQKRQSAPRLLWESIRWAPRDGTPDGLYEIRGEIRDGGPVAVQDTSYAASIRGPQNASRIGETAASGMVSTSDRSRFPPSYGVPVLKVRDGNGILPYYSDGLRSPKLFSSS